MSKVQAAVNEVDQQILTYTPAVIAGVQAAEQLSVSGSTKAAIVLNTIQAGSGVIAGSSAPPNAFKIACRICCKALLGTVGPLVIVTRNLIAWVAAMVKRAKSRARVGA